MENINKRIERIENELKLLPRGSIGKKTIKGKIYYYHRYTENSKKHETYLNNEEVLEFTKKIELRKSLEKELKELKINLKSNLKNNNLKFTTNIKIGEELKNYIEIVKNYQKRNCFRDIQSYLYNNIYDKVLILCGLRRTGKTTLIRQAILEMNENDLNKTAFIQIQKNDTLSKVNKDLKKLESLGYKYIFIDEITLMEDFIEGAALFSDIYASSGMKIVLSGNDSLSFMITKSEQLYDRSVIIHTTFIPYHEFEKVLGIKGIDEYIRYGGTMSLSGINYNQEYLFKNEETTNEYIDTAIAKNIQHSLKYYDNGNHFRHLQELYEKNELTNVINRVVEDINHRFTKDVLTKEFKSNDLAISSRNLRKDRFNPTTILDEIDIDSFTKRLKEMLEILDKKEQSLELKEIHISEIKEYLKLLDLIYEIDVRSFPNVNDIEKKIIITQPGLRYIQAISLIDSLLQDNKFNELSLNTRNYIETRITNEIKGRMLEDIILLETKIANPKKEVFKLQFAIGEFDMVIFDKSTSTSEIFEIKYSQEINKEQFKNLIDFEKLSLTENKFGEIKNKYVIYRGVTKAYENINYLNVEEYLKSLYESKQ